MGLNQYDAETVLKNHQYLNTKRDLEDSKSDDSPRKRRDLELEVAEATLTKPTESITDTSNSTTEGPKRKDKTGQRPKSRPKVVSEGTKGQKKSKHEAKSDEATVQMVVNELEKRGWKPLGDGHEMRMDANQEGFDIQAIHPDKDILWRVECKGRVAKWGPSNVEISERQMHHALEFNGKEINGKIIQYSLAVIEESESTPKIRFVPFMEYDLKFVFSRDDWDQDSDLDTVID